MCCYLRSEFQESSPDGEVRGDEGAAASQGTRVGVECGCATCGHCDKAEGPVLGGCWNP